MASRTTVTKEMVERVHALCKHKISATAVEGRLRRGWTEEKIINTGHKATHSPAKTHPYKNRSYQNMLKRKGVRNDS